MRVISNYHQFQLMQTYAIVMFPLLRIIMISVSIAFINDNNGLSKPDCEQMPVVMDISADFCDGAATQVHIIDHLRLYTVLVSGSASDREYCGTHRW